MRACCIVYTTDEMYLFPTIVSAIQARAHSSVDKADVAIFGFGVDPRTERDFAAICRQEGIKLILVNQEVLEGANAMMARLFLNDFVPSQYTQYLYMDGDVQIVSSLDPLIDADVPSGRFLAVNDPMTFVLAEEHGDGLMFARYMASIGLRPEQSSVYLNTGVLRINRDGWDEIGRRTREICRKAAQPFRFPDQDPLNIAAGDAHMTMSLAWNFPIFMRNARVEAQIRPCIYHFMSNPKPWQGAFAPWPAGAFATYRDAVRRHPSLAAYYKPFPFQKKLRYHLQQRYKQANEIVTWGCSARRDRILLYEQQVTFPGHGWAENVPRISCAGVENDPVFDGQPSE
jgi:lipopolysaccharide biosynthesis glycosyltransferase